MFADPVPGGGSGGEFPFPAAQREKHVTNPFRNRPVAGDPLSGMDVDELKQCGHFGQSFGTAHRGAGPEDLSASAVVLPPEHDPVPASRRFALLKTTALETPAASRGGRVSPFIFRHGRTIPSETARSESVLDGKKKSARTQERTRSAPGSGVIVDDSERLL